MNNFWKFWNNARIIRAEKYDRNGIFQMSRFTQSKIWYGSLLKISESRCRVQNIFDISAKLGCIEISKYNFRACRFGKYPTKRKNLWLIFASKKRIQFRGILIY